MYESEPFLRVAAEKLKSSSEEKERKNYNPLIIITFKFVSNAHLTMA